MDSQKKHGRSFSFEFFPPRNAEGAEQLRATTRELAALGPKYFSVTFGAGGSTKSGTYETVKEIAARGLRAAPHISGISSSRTEIRELLERYRALGVERLVVLRGDLPKDGGGKAGEFRYAAELVEFVRAETGRRFHIEVAAYPEFHPESPSPKADIDRFVEKLRAGADAAITQYFYSAEAYFRFVEACEARAVSVPIVPGVMPITNYKQLARFSDACGAEIPRWIRKRLEAYGDDLVSIRAFGLEVVGELCARLLAAGAPGLHFYTLNRAAASAELWRRLDLPRAA